MSDPVERDAMLKFIGNIFGQAKKMDSMVVERSKDLRPIHQNIQNTFETELRSSRPGPVVIQPTPQELAATGLAIPPVPLGYMPGTLPTAQPVFDVVPQMQVAHTEATSYPMIGDDTRTSFVPVMPTYPPVVNPQPAHYQYTPNPSDSNLEVIRLLNTILDKLKIIELQNGQPTPRKPKSTRTVSRRSTKDQ